MKILRRIAKALARALRSRDEPQMGTLDYETGKVTW